MKFGHEFTAVLQSDEFPEYWVQVAVPYRRLKKQIKLTLRELKDNGFDPQDLRQLEAQYAFQPTESDDLKPKLILSLSPEQAEKTALAKSPEFREWRDAPGERGVWTTGVDIVAASEFFRMLQADIRLLTALTVTEEAALTTQVEVLQGNISAVALPHKRFRTSDLSVWRELMALYIEAQIFMEPGRMRKSQAALEKLSWFQDQVAKQGLLDRFKLPQSRLVFNQFLKLNFSVWKGGLFQELNHKAVAKILKKFDKRTTFSTSSTVPKLLPQQFNASLSRSICAAITTELLPITPQLDDYLCPVCYSVPYRAMRLECSHVFCIRCVVKLQQKGVKSCPMCRATTVEVACLTNLDRRHEKFLKKNFPKEVKEKAYSNDLEMGKEMWGEDYVPMSCLVM